MSHSWYAAELASGFARLDEIECPDPWFRVFAVSDSLFVLHEPRHYEGVNAYLLVGDGGAILIDTGCGIGDLRAVVSSLTPEAVTVVNTHTHLDHVAANDRFDEVLMFDHSFARRLADQGASNIALRRDLLAPDLVEGAWPPGFDPARANLPPFRVRRFLGDGEVVAVGGRELEVIYTPGEAADHICLLERSAQTLFCGDILLHGAVWSHLEHGSIEQLAASYGNLLARVDEFDVLMPSHSEPGLPVDLLSEAAAGAKQILSRSTDPTYETDPWGRRYRRHAFERISILEAVL
jgi:glyoxylase-like metal-dependent hydrolase (beta-lactamase superfamily II)